MKTLDIIKPTRPHLKHRALPLAALTLMALASSAAAEPLYQESFATPCTSADFSATYPGFSQSGTAVNVNADGYASTDSAAGIRWSLADHAGVHAGIRLDLAADDFRGDRGGGWQRREEHRGVLRQCLRLGHWYGHHVPAIHSK